MDCRAVPITNLTGRGRGKERKGPWAQNTHQLLSHLVIQGGVTDAERHCQEPSLPFKQDPLLEEQHPYPPHLVRRTTPRGIHPGAEVGNRYFQTRIPCNPHQTLWDRRYHHPHFTDEETKAKVSPGVSGRAEIQTKLTALTGHSERTWGACVGAIVW